ncbi:MAG: hypothetical protein LH473_07845 [Chitinophagales bacterium]|nr:hypothetical protein [Chitinophagales bacterium]
MVKAQVPPVKQWELDMPTTLGTCNDEEWFYQIIQTADGGYLGAGYAYIDPGSNNNCQNTFATMVKYDAAGSMIWEQACYISNTNFRGFFTDVIEVSDGYIAIGQFKITSTSKAEVELYKVNKSDGTTQTGFQKVFGITELSNLANEAGLVTATGVGGRPSIREIKLANGSTDGFILGMNGSALDINSMSFNFALLVRTHADFSFNNDFDANGYKVFANAGPISSSCENVRVIYDGSNAPVGFMLAGQYHWEKDPVSVDDDALVMNLGLTGNVVLENHYSETSLGGSYLDVLTSDINYCNYSNAEICDNVLVDPTYLLNSTDNFVTRKRAGTLNFIDITNAHYLHFTD